jgi:hypothetical protein
VNGRRRTEQEHAVCGLPTRTIRVTCGKRTIEREMGSGRTDQGPIEWMSDEEAERMVREPAAVRQV